MAASSTIECVVKDIPLLDAVESLQGRDGDKDDNSLLAVADLDLKKDHKSACELQDVMPWTASRPVPRSQSTAGDAVRSPIYESHDQEFPFLEKSGV